jgi:hypothetical protein
MARPQLKITTLELEKLGNIGATQPDIARFFNVSLATIERRLEKQEYRLALDRGYGNLDLSLRRQQVMKAEQGNVTMLIWLGKNRLGQRDNLDTKLTGSGPNGELEVASSTAADRIEGRMLRIAERRRTL